MLAHDSAATQPLRIPRPPLSRTALRAWWGAEGGYREVLQLAWPLFLSMGSSTILQFFDRMFLTWYSTESMAASTPSGMLAYTFQSFFIAMVGYASVFVAQYTGAERPRQAIASVWQALYLAVISAVLVLACIPVGAGIFALAGHAPHVQAQERTFFNILIAGSFVFMAGSAVSAYFIGRGMTRIILWANLLSVTVNIILLYLLVFGQAGFPRMGIAGAATASVIAQSCSLVVLFVAFLQESRAGHAVGAWKPDFTLVRRVIRYGAANGLQHALDMVGWTFFLLLVGRLGEIALGASTIAFQINGFSFFPILGFGMAASTLVGQSLGKNRPDLADRAVWSAIHMGLLYTGIFAVLFVLVPGWIIAPIGAKADPVTWAPVRDEVVVMLRFVAAYCLFDTGNLVFSAALKGAGDTLYVMLLSLGCSATLMILPTILWCIQPGGLGIMGAWSFLTLNVIVLVFAFLLRYLAGHWRWMRVIEQEVI